MIDTTLRIRRDAPIGTISPRVYGHFAEHLGRCCYDGLWVGKDNREIKNYGGFRADVVDALKVMPAPMLRWPGGCYADHYHWRDGIGPAAQRPVRLGLSCGLQVEDDNAIGTHEFLALCRMIGAEPYLAGNVGSGSVQELCDWVEYCNSAVNTALARERAANGQAAPYGVKLWGVGNENWGCGGMYDAESYAREYRRYASMLRHVDPRAELVACGHDDAWNELFFKTNQRKMHLDTVDHFSIHRYWLLSGSEAGFNAEQYYALLQEADETEDFVIRTANLAREYSGGRAIGIALDEWGVWHPEARPWGPNNEQHREPVTYEQAGTLRDALAAGAAFEGFHRQAAVLSMANLAQTVNVLHAPIMTDGAAMWLTPTYHAFQLHTPHVGATALPVDIAHGAALPSGASNAVSATASGRDGRMAVTLINRHMEQGASVRLTGVSGALLRADVLSADSARAANSAQQPDQVKLAPITVHPNGTGGWRIELPPHSMMTAQFAG